MNVIFNTADSFRDSAQATNRAAQILVKIVAPRIAKEWTAIFRGKHDVVMQT